MATLLKTVAGNTAPPLTITCQRDGTAINLTGCTIELIISGSGTITQSGGNATVTDASNGIITYTPLATDFPTAGGYKCDVKVTYSDLSVEILYQQLKVKARAPLV
jgi:hypothetical protein